MPAPPLKAQVAGNAAEAEHLGVVLAQELLAQGAGDLLKPFITNMS